MNNLLQIRQTFSRIHQLMKKIDPLQHHGLIIATEIDLKSYTDQIIPIIVFKKMKCMSGCSQIKGNMRALKPGFDHLINILHFIIEIEQKKVFEHHAYRDEYLLSEYRNYENGMYQLKYYLGQFLLIPSLYMTAIGESCYKKESFKIIQDKFPEDVVEWINVVSNLRIKWGERENINYHPNKIPNWVMEIIPKDYFFIGSKIAQSLLTHIDSLHD